MFFLQNNEIILSIIDPLKDQHLLSSRYCHGGYIWQIEDKKRGQLLSGPSFPSPSPDPFDGQGMPEAFETAIGYYPSRINDSILVIGVGEVLKTSVNEPFHSCWNPYIHKWSTWTIKTDDYHVKMSTMQHYKGYSLNLVKLVILKDRTVESLTEIENNGINPIPMKWFAHPFFPINADLTCCQLSLPLKIPINNGFSLNSENFICMNSDYKWENGCYQSLDIPWNQQLNVLVHHPLLGISKIKCNFLPTWLPIWANRNTFSLEPFFSKMISPGKSEKWSIKYEF